MSLTVHILNLILNPKSQTIISNNGQTFGALVKKQEKLISVFIKYLFFLQYPRNCELLFSYSDEPGEFCVSLSFETGV